MKKTLIKLCSVAAIGLALTACNNDAANKAAQDSDNASIEQLVSDKVKTLDDSLTTACEAKVTLAAEEKIKSEPAAKGGTAHAPTAHKPAPAKPAEKKDEPKQGGLKGKSDQAAPANGGGLKSKSDQAAPANGGGLRGKRDQ